MKTCCFTGHRKLFEQDNIQLTKNLENEINNLISQGVTTFLSGGALGFDQMCASIIIDKKQLNPSIKLIFILPCVEQDKFWTVNQKQIYKHLLSNADDIIYTSEIYTSNCMKMRNQELIQLSEVCLCALRNNHSGTAQTVRLANRKGIPVINILIKKEYRP